MFFKKKQDVTSVEETESTMEAAQNTAPEQNPKRNINWKKIGIIAGSVAAVCLVVFVGFGIYFQSHFYFRSTINGTKTSGVNVSTAKDRLSASAKGYELKITDKKKNIKTLTADDLGIEIDITDKKLQNIMDKQNGFMWVYYLFNPKEYVDDALVSCDEDTLNKTVFGLCMELSQNATPTVNANVKYNKGEFQVVDEIYGTEIVFDDFRNIVEKTAQTLDKNLDMTADKCYKQPEYTADSKEIKSLIKSLNSYVNTKITYTVGNEKEEIPKDTIGSWLMGNDDMKPGFNDELMGEFVSAMGKKYNTYGQPKTLNSQYGVTVTVPGGNYGWKIDKDKEIAQLKEDLAKGKDVSRDFVYQYTAASRDGNDYGNTYVEINYTAQMVYLIVNGSCVMSTPCVTGNPNNGHYTPCGAYRITYCEKDAILKGDNYRTHVSYWMPFNGDIGLHDAVWQKSFGGQRYREGFGSHGCVNLPLSAAGTIFANVKAGYPVLLYELPGTETIDTLTQQNANNCIDAINSIGEVTADSGQPIADARAMYEELTDSGKGLVTNIQVLIDAENAYNNILAQIAQQQAAAQQAAQQAAEEAARQQAQQQSQQQSESIKNQISQQLGQ